MYRGLLSSRPENLPVAVELAQKVICLPIYPDLSRDEIEFIVSLIASF
jgi:dTDP-4-amino-4,6-dideoxygalactose transaminase